MPQGEMTTAKPLGPDGSDKCADTATAETPPAAQVQCGEASGTEQPAASDPQADDKPTRAPTFTSEPASTGASMSLALSMSPSQSLERVRRCQSQVLESLERYAEESQERRGSSASPAARRGSPRREAGCGPSHSELGSLSPLSPLSSAIAEARRVSPLLLRRVWRIEVSSQCVVLCG